MLKAQLKQVAGDTNGARDALLAYIQVEPFDPSGYIVLGNFYAGNKDTARAIEAFTQVKTLAPQTQGIDEVLKKLKTGVAAQAPAPATPAATSVAPKAPVKKK